MINVPLSPMWIDSPAGAIAMNTRRAQGVNGIASAAAPVLCKPVATSVGREAYRQAIVQVRVKE